jgi:hypothetical protein
VFFDAITRLMVCRWFSSVVLDTTKFISLPF